MEIPLSHGLDRKTEADDELLDLYTCSNAPIRAMAMGNGKPCFEINVWGYNGWCGNLKTRVDDKVYISVIAFFIDSIVPISCVETSSQVEKTEELRAQSSVHVKCASNTDVCQGGNAWRKTTTRSVALTTTWCFCFSSAL